MLSPQLPAPAAITSLEDPTSSSSPSGYFGRSASAAYSNYNNNHHHDDEFSHNSSGGGMFTNSGSRHLSHSGGGRPVVLTRKVSTASFSHISHVVHAIKQRSVEELGGSSSASNSAIFTATYESLLEWISQQRMSELPAEGSSYDKVLAWAELFADRLHSFDYAVQEFAGDSYLAAQLSYGYCSLLLNVSCCLLSHRS